MIDEGAILGAAQALLEAAPDSRVILFGSYARGDAGSDSDLDFLVIEPSLSSRRREMVRLRHVLRPLGIPVDVLVTSAATFEKWADTPGTVLYEAATEGRGYGPLP